MAFATKIPIVDIGFKIKGDIHRRLSEQLPMAAREWALAQEHDLKRGVRRLSPVKTGYMRRRAFTHVSGGGFLWPTLHVGGRAYYTKFQNDGTRYIQPPRLFVDRAVERVLRTRVTTKPHRRTIKA